ncbi:unnamed protein product [Gadus morhua 'NCC']
MVRVGDGGGEGWRWRSDSLVTVAMQPWAVSSHVTVRVLLDVGECQAIHPQTLLKDYLCGSSESLCIRTRFIKELRCLSGQRYP